MLAGRHWFSMVSNATAGHCHAYDNLISRFHMPGVAETMLQRLACPELAAQGCMLNVMM